MKRGKRMTKAEKIAAGLVKPEPKPAPIGDLGAKLIEAGWRNNLIPPPRNWGNKG